MEILLSNAYYMYAKNTTKPIANDMKDFQESIVTSSIGPTPSNHHLNPQASFQHLSTILPTEKIKKKKILSEHVNTVQEPKASGNEIWISVLSQ